MSAAFFASCVSAACALKDGTVICPNKLEALYSTSPFIQQVYVHCDPSITRLAAVVVPDLNAHRTWLDSHRRQRNANHIAFEELLLSELQKMHIEAYLPPAAVVLSEPFTEENGYMTGTFKLKRKALSSAFGAILLDKLNELGV